jgi:nucleotide-binding universal stress UspA family protein
VLQRCELIAVCVWEPPTIAPYAPVDTSPSRTMAAARAGLIAVVGALARSLPGVWVRPVLASGVPARVLIGHARAAGLLVVGGEHRSRCHTDPSVGAVALACLRRAPCPVVIVPPPCLPEAAPERSASRPGKRAIGARRCQQALTQ